MRFARLQMKEQWEEHTQQLQHFNSASKFLISFFLNPDLFLWSNFPNIAAICSNKELSGRAATFYCLYSWMLLLLSLISTNL